MKQLSLDVATRGFHGSRRKRRSIVTGSLVALLTAILVTVTSATAQTAPDWSAYLNGPAHSSYQAAATTISSSNVSQLTPMWTWSPTEILKPGEPPQRLDASPTVSGGRIFIGSEAGYFYSIDASTGQVVWSRFLGYRSKTTCGGAGVIATATVAPDPVTLVSTVYVTAGDGYLYAMRADNGSVVWKSLVAQPSTSVNDYKNWSSPTVQRGHVYVGISSSCDNPLIRGGEVAYNQHTGVKQSTHYTVAQGGKGNSVWSSAAGLADGSIVITTGNANKNLPTGPDNQAIVRLKMTRGNLLERDAWSLPKAERTPDSDFGGSATVFTANLAGTQTPMVGACNKNGVYYALRQSALNAGPVWRFAVSLPYGSDNPPGQCDAAAIWDGSHLYVGGNGTTINGTAYRGSVRQLDPATGQPVWETGLDGEIIGSPTMDGAGVIAAVTYNTKGSNSLYLLDSTTGALLQTLPLTGTAFAQPVFAGDDLFTAAGTTLTAWGLATP